MISSLPAPVKGDIGVSGVALIVYTQLGWHFRPQPIADVGIDAQVETMVDEVPTGRLLALQIKAGGSWFDELTPEGDGWIFRESSQKHRRYWLRYRLPVILVLYDIEAHAAYWQLITADTAVPTGAGFKVMVPRDQKLDASAAEPLAAFARQAPDDPFSTLRADLPPSCASSLEVLADTAPVVAQQIAEILIDGRDDPGAAVRRILSSDTPVWPWLAWSAVSEYAGEFGLTTLAADCMLRALHAADDDPVSGRLAAYAGFHLVNEHPDRAQDLFTQAVDTPDAALLAALGLAAIEHGQQKGPIPIPAIVSERSEQAATDATIQRFLADHAGLSGDAERAITHHERALALAPHSAAQMLALAEALLRRSQPESGTTNLNDYRRAAQLASKARDARRRCWADSVPAATILLQSLGLSGDERSAIRVATPGPDGEATETEAASPALAFYAARLCYELGDTSSGDQFADVIAAANLPSWIAHCAAVKASNGDTSAEEQIGRWNEFLATDAPDDQRLVALNNLADLGVWPLAELDRLQVAGYLTPGTYDTIHAQALSVSGRHEEAFILLRRNHQNSSITAESYARQLAQRDLIDESIRVCEETAHRFGDPRFDLLALDILNQAGRIDEVIVRATELLGHDNLPFNMRHRLRLRLIDVHGNREDWFRSERLAATGLAEIRRHVHGETTSASLEEPLIPARADLDARLRDYSWALILSKYRRGQIDEATAKLNMLQASPVTSIEIATWADLHRTQGWTTATAEQALSLATQDGIVTSVTGPILLSLLQSCHDPSATDDETGEVGHGAVAVPVSEDFLSRLGEAWASFVARNPPGVLTLNLDDPQFTNKIGDLLRPRTIGLEQALTAVRAGQFPHGILSAVARRPYLHSLVQNAAGLFNAVNPLAEVQDREVEAARDALGHAISIEGSALYLAAAATPLWPVLRDVFLDFRIAQPAARDIHISHIAARDTANSAGTIGADPRSGTLFLAASDDATRQHELEASAAVLRASQECRPTGVIEPVLNRGPQPETTEPWLAPIDVALQHNIALYSDDAALRAIATSVGVHAFGSLALLEVLMERGHTDATTTETVIEKLFLSNAVDLPNIWPLLLATARRPGGTITRPVLMNLTRSAFWRDIGQDRFVNAVSVLAQEVGRAPEHIATLTSAMAAGLTTTFGPPDQVLAILATVMIVQATELTADAVAPVLQAVVKVAGQHSADVSGPLRQNLVATFTDPEGDFVMSTGEAERRTDGLLVSMRDGRQLETDDQ
ncbi:DUF4365 domain-containing protein [Winogradskya humida]|uniref:DUF4365 domain-containing protein n=1 Tax=Winogradskya humida TaxID=113566 RepID=A0ABQ4A1Z6_9ACTN|nr:DUF4365 domain-containing protein [Actinoplanes humidus]GIE24874.1 hypothetical protein Ahu01nite_079760 [Actinoplanes humidus]